ncbi:MAG: radical SAM protein [Candidatus Riflebacteria bacterium]|nr:radical SAM protein [Candidatus Riflebacteria bacterium]
MRQALRPLLPKEFKGLLDELLEVGSRRPLELIRVVPRRTLAVSLTGHQCGLNCAHCGGHYLKGMRPIQELSDSDFSIADSLLISGGSDASGAVPIINHLERLLSLPAHLKLNLHLGIQEITPIKPLLERPGITVSCDLIGDRETILETFGLSHTPGEYFSLYTEAAAIANTVPHLTLGLRGGRLSGEENVIESLRQCPPSSLTFLSFRPTPDTTYASSPPIAPQDAAKIIGLAARILPASTRLHVGCMRPAGAWRKEFDVLSWAAGARTLVMPDRELAGVLESIGIPVRESLECCSL